ncbi:hypothetical protein BU17DRAFT_72809 [Hysterangium stoloniferum]|nr:hypothetical protein BU17DRAFT_72809 [Hysterangium stoloniferum]
MCDPEKKSLNKCVVGTPLSGTLVSEALNGRSLSSRPSLLLASQNPRAILGTNVSFSSRHHVAFPSSHVENLDFFHSTKIMLAYPLRFSYQFAIYLHHYIMSNDNGKFLCYRESGTFTDTRKATKVPIIDASSSLAMDKNLTRLQ